MVKIVTDTTSDLPPQLAQELGVSIVPLLVRFGTETYRDGVDINTEDFYRRLTESNVLPTTSAPGPGVFAELFTSLARETDEILAIMLSEKYSVIHESACQGKDMVKANCRIEVIDSMSAIGGEMLLVLSAAKAAQKGASLEQISDMVKKAIPRTHVRMSFDTLEYLKRGGRIGKAQALLGSLLKINPIVGIKDGETFPYGRVRSRAQAMDFLVNFVKGFPKIEGLVIEDATTPDELEMLAERIGNAFPKERTYQAKVGSVVGTHVGPHVLAVSVLEAEQ